MSETATVIKPARSGINSQNLQEIIDASVSVKHATMGNQQQYETPPAFAAFFNSLLPAMPSNAFDPQVASGNTVRHGMAPWTTKFGFELDRRFADSIDSVMRVTGNCVSAWEALDDIAPGMEFVCQNANPPFGLLWPLPDGSGKVDSTEYTWRKIQEHASTSGFGWFISNHKTIERLKIHEHPRVYLYQKFPMGVWKGTEVEIGVVHWDVSPDRANRTTLNYQTLDLDEHGGWCEDIKEHYRKHPRGHTGAEDTDIGDALRQVQTILKEESKNKKPFNVWLDSHGNLQAYLSTRFQIKRKITRPEVLSLYRINNCHPLTFTCEKETRTLMFELINSDIYTIEPAAKKAIVDALNEVNSLSAPIMPITDFESVAYADEEDQLECHTDYRDDSGKLLFTAGKSYALETNSYAFVEKFLSEKPHYDEHENKMYTVQHKCELSGSDRYIAFQDDSGFKHRFMERPQSENFDHDETTLWKIFKKPLVQTIAETHPQQVAKNELTLASCEILAGFSYYPGQIGYLSRVGVKNYGILAGAVGTGKTLMTISLIQMKGPKRALIIAPQGTMRTSGTLEDDEDEAMEYQASQWVEELTKFGPGLAVFQLFSMEDYERIMKANSGRLPEGVYISYYEAMFSNKGRESAASDWNDERLEAEIHKIIGSTKPKLGDPLETTANPLRYWCESVGREKNGIRCIMKPCMATLIGDQFDFVALDEGHKACNLSATVTQMLIRLQPHYRYVFTATPIPNVVSNLFSLMGWVCVPGWYRYDNRNAAWPYAREDIGRFIETFQSTVRDFTQEEINEADAKKNNTKYKGKVEKTSPIISAPARLLKILKPSMAYISKPMCNPNYKEAKIVDVRVPMGSQQTQLYAHFMNRGNIPAKNPLVRARMQMTYLRNVCADPAGFTHGGPKVNSNFNPKTVAILELCRDIINRGEQVVIVCARKGQTNTIHTNLKDAGILVSRIDSTVPAEQHSYQSNLFKSKRTQVNLMGIKCAMGHSYHECPNMIIGSLEYSCGSLEQARGRIDRVNSKYDRTIYCVLHKHSIEAVMFDIVATKSDSATICLQGRRVPRDYHPVDMSEVLAMSITGFKDIGMDEQLCQDQWPKLRASFQPPVKDLAA